MRCDYYKLEKRLFEKNKDEELNLRKRIIYLPSFSDYFEELQNWIRNAYEKSIESFKEVPKHIKEYAKHFVEKIYNLPKGYLDQIPIKIVDYIPSRFPGTKVLGSYEYVKDNFGRIFYQSILISKDALKDYSTFFKTLVHEFTHVAQNYYGKLKQKIHESLGEYFSDSNEIEAENIAKKAWYNFLTYYIGKGKSNYAARVYLL